MEEEFEVFGMEEQGLRIVSLLEIRPGTAVVQSTAMVDTIPMSTVHLSTIRPITLAVDIIVKIAATETLQIAFFGVTQRRRDRR